MSYLIDTDVFIDGMTGNALADGWLKAHAADGLSVSIITVAELYHGAYRARDVSRHMDSIRVRLREFTVLSLEDWEVEAFGRIKANLQQRGLIVPDFDLLIAATALHYGLTLVTRNVRHFQRIPGLTIEEPM